MTRGRVVLPLLLVAACHSGTTASQPTPSPTPSAPDPILAQIQPQALDSFCAQVALLHVQIAADKEAVAYRAFQQLDASKIFDERLRADAARLKSAPDVPSGAKQVQAMLDRCAALGHDQRQP